MNAQASQSESSEKTKKSLEKKLKKLWQSEHAADARGERQTPGKD